MHRQQSLSTGSLLCTAALAFSVMAFFSSPCSSQTAKQLRIGTQFGLGYLPLYVADETHLFAKRMREQGIEPVPVEIVHVAGGPQINDGLLSGNFEIGSGGYTAMMVSWDKSRNAGDFAPSRRHRARFGTLRAVQRECRAQIGKGPQSGAGQDRRAIGQSVGAGNLPADGSGTAVWNG